ncbi:MAG: NAD-dependent epimerase/dehydratase family protein, partial [Candidatus Zixiibacteriota bacterium]
CRPIAHHRESSDTRFIDSLGLEKRVADLRNDEQIAKLVQGVDAVIHTAAWVDFRGDRFTQFTGINTFGAINMYKAARKAGVRRFVHVSTVAAVGARRRHNGRHVKREPAPITEEYEFNLDHLRIPYILTKRAAETELLQLARDGAPELVIVNPSIILAPSRTGDDRGKAMRWFSRPLMPDFSNWVNLVDIRDVAPAIVNALTKGRPGERYILGGDNITVRDLVLGVSVILHKAPHLVTPPRPLIELTARLSHWYTTIIHRKKQVFYPDLVKLIDYDWVFSSAKARRELGYQCRSAHSSLQDLLYNRFNDTHMKPAFEPAG